MIVRDILSSAYVLMNNVSEKELPYIIALEQFGNVWSKMKFEKILGNRNELMIKAELTIDETGQIENTLTDFGDLVFARFNGQPIEEAPVSMLDLYKDAGRQGVGFWTDATDDTSYIQMAITSSGTLELWYEPNLDNESAETEVLPLNDNLRYSLAIRLAYHCIDYVIYENPAKTANKSSLKQTLYSQYEDWKQDWLEKINKTTTDRPFQRIPFMAS